MRATAERYPRNDQRGFTLIEVIVGIVAFGILMALLVVVFAPNIVRGTDPLYSVRAAELGQSMLDEILGKRFAENSPPGNATRCGEGTQPACTTPLGRDSGETTHATFDDVDDYDYLNTNPDSPPTDNAGNVRPDYTGFSVRVQVVSAGADLGLANTLAKRITVTVTAPNGGSFVFATYKANF